MPRSQKRRCERKNTDIQWGSASRQNWRMGCGGFTFDFRSLMDPEKTDFDSAVDMASTVPAHQLELEARAATR
jgi:hypothetical protein